MKCLPFVFAAAALAPSVVHAQNQQFSDCRTLAAAGNFVGADEAIVDGLVCKVTKPKTNSAASPQGTSKLADRSLALLGIIEPEVLRSKEKAGANAAVAVPTPSVPPGPAPSNSFAAEPLASSSAIASKPSLGEIARAYRRDAQTRLAGNNEEVKPETERRSDEAKPFARPATPYPTKTAAPVPHPPPPQGTQALSAVRSPEPAATKQVVAAHAPVLSTGAEASASSKSEVTATPQTQLSTAKQENNRATTTALHSEPVAKPETSSATMAAASSSVPNTQPSAQTAILPAVQETGIRVQPAVSLSSSSKDRALEPQPGQLLSAGSFAVPPSVVTNPPSQFEAFSANEEDAAFREGQAPTCRKNVSLGSMDKDKLFLAIPDWALKWLEKNQRRFPGICFSDSLMPGAKNYLVVFYMSASPAAGVGALKNVSAPGEIASGSGMGGFTTSYGSTWHYTHERTVTTTITSASAEKAPHNQPATLMYATAYSEQGVPVSHHLPAAVTKQVKETPHKAGKKEDAELPEFHAMSGLLGQMIEEITRQ